jgi:DNA-binding GntR family transcriptional regulator
VYIAGDRRLTHLDRPADNEHRELLVALGERDLSRATQILAEHINNTCVLLFGLPSSAS